MRVCRQCQGRGDKVCPYCRNDPKRQPCRECNSRGFVICPPCSGTGELKGEESLDTYLFNKQKRERDITEQRKVDSPERPIDDGVVCGHMAYTVGGTAMRIFDISIDEATRSMIEEIRFSIERESE